MTWETNTTLVFFPGFFGRFSVKNVRFRGITWDFGIGFVWIPNLKKEKKEKSVPMGERY